MPPYRSRKKIIPSCTKANDRQFPLKSHGLHTFPILQSIENNVLLKQFTILPPCKTSKPSKQQILRSRKHPPPLPSQHSKNRISESHSNNTQNNENVSSSSLHNTNIYREHCGIYHLMKIISIQPCNLETK